MEGRKTGDSPSMILPLKIELQVQTVILYPFRVEELAEGYAAPQVNE